jgi:pimeloyl-ACP methyl ester carboxylesterase
LTLTVYDVANNPAFVATLNLSLDGVEQMFRHKNLIQSIGAPSAPPLENAEVGESKTKGGEGDRIKNPRNFPDSESSEEYLVWVHGFNVNGQNVRGWHAEMFKRLYWSGSRARFVGVSWYGFQEQPANYHPNVVHAFKTAEMFGESLQEIVGDAKTTLLAHSLGNMLVSSYLCDHFTKPAQKLNIKSYFLLNAAVPLEAYLGDHQGYADPGNLTQPYDNSEASNDMVHSAWHGYHRRLGASEWHQLFAGDSIDGQPDHRSRLTWRGRFAELPTDEINVFSFYSTGEDVLASFAGTIPTFSQFINMEFGRNSWVLQEKWKGKFPVNFLGSKYMGWGFNFEDYTNWVDSNWHGDVGIEEAKFLSPAEANSIINSEELKTKPFFRKFNDGQEEAKLLVPGSEGSEYAKTNRARFLGLAIPALTTPTGGWKGEDIKKKKYITYLNMNNQKNEWPSERLEMKDWLHSDIRNVAFPYVHKAIFEIVVRGAMQ